MECRHEQSPDQWLTSEPTPWFSTAELLEYLGISKNELIKQFDLFTEGLHYKKENPKDPKSKRLWRIDLVDEVLCLPVPALEKEAMLNAINNVITCKK